VIGRYQDFSFTTGVEQQPSAGSKTAPATEGTVCTLRFTEWISVYSFDAVSRSIGSIIAHTSRLVTLVSDNQEF